MTILNNPLRFVMGDSLASYPNVLSFYEDFLSRLWKRYPKGLIDIILFIENETPFTGPVTKNFWIDCRNCVTLAQRDWFFDPYILEADWTNKYDCHRRLKWLAETLIYVINHRIEPCWTEPVPNNCFDYAFEKFYSKGIGS